MTGKFDGVYFNVPHGFVGAFEKLGWELLPHVYRGIHHGEYAESMKWSPEKGEPKYPRGFKTKSQAAA